jgi:hypothetical protein
MGEVKNSWTSVCEACYGVMVSDKHITESFEVFKLKKNTKRAQQMLK